MALDHITDLFRRKSRFSSSLNQALAALKPFDELVRSGTLISHSLANVEEVQAKQGEISHALSLALGDTVSGIKILSNGRERVQRRALTWREDDSDDVYAATEQLYLATDIRCDFDVWLFGSLGGYMRRRLLGPQLYEELQEAYRKDLGNELCSNMRGTFWRGLEDSVFGTIETTHRCYLGALLINDQQLVRELAPLVTTHLLRSPPVCLEMASENTWVVFAY